MVEIRRPNGLPMRPAYVLVVETLPALCLGWIWASMTAEVEVEVEEDCYLAKPVGKARYVCGVLLVWGEYGELE